MADLYETFDKTLYRIGTAVYQTDSLSDVTAVPAVTVSGVSPTTDPGQAVSTPTTTTNEMVQGSYQSGDFLTGVRGWIIRANGDVEFGSGYFRGDITGASGTFTGTLTASTGSIGGFTIASGSLSTGAFDTLNTMYFGTSGLSLSNTFKVDSAGALTATGITVTGALTTGVGSSINGGYLTALSVTAAKIAANTITADKIAAGTITANEIQVNTLTVGTNVGIGTAKQVFTTTPTTPYYVGDLWAGGSTSDLKKCITQRLTGAYQAGDWDLASKYTDDSALNTFVSGVYAGDISGLQSQIDGQITTWFYAYVPSLINLPASDWTTSGMKDDHLGDLFYSTVTGYAYRFQVVTGTYSWQQLSDSDIAAALLMASNAQDTADGKRRVFTATPTTPYDVGDLWLTSLSATTGDLKKCVTAAPSGAYNAAHWLVATKYTDDTTVNNLVSALGDLAYEDLVSAAKLDSTVIVGGYLKTSLIEANTLIVGTNVALGTAQDSAGVTSIIGSTVTTGFVNALGVNADTVSANIAITSPTIIGGIIKTASTVGAGSTGVIMDTAGLRGYDSVLGNTFNLPTDGSRPSFASGDITLTNFKLETVLAIRTSDTVGSGGGTTTTAAMSPGTMADDATVGTVAWSDPNNAKVEDGSNATTVLNNQTSHYLKATNFGFAIPTGLTITGILVEIKKKQVIDGNYIKDSEVKIVKSDGSIGTTNKADTIDYWTGTLLYSSYGGASDLWGQTWTAEDINNSNFGTVISAIGITTACTVYIDCIRITVSYGNGSSAGILINNTGLYACEENQTLANANVKILIDGSATIKMNVKGGQTDFATGTGYFLGLSGGDYKLSVGSDTSYLRWNGTQMILKGSFDVGTSGLINNAVYTVANLPIAPTVVGFNVPSAYE